MMLYKKPVCPLGYSLRECYKTKNGKIIKAQCIKKNKHIEPITMTYKQNTISKQKNTHTQNTKKSCKDNEILRKGYTRHSYHRKLGKYKGLFYKQALISPGCIKKRTYKKHTIRNKKRQSHTKKQSRTKKQNKNRTLIMLNQDDHFLSKYGYFDVVNKTKEERITSLTKLINYFLPIKGEIATYTYIIKALNARYILNKNSNPKTAKLFKEDQNTISKIYKKI